MKKLLLSLLLMVGLGTQVSAQELAINFRFRIDNVEYVVDTKGNFTYIIDMRSGDRISYSLYGDRVERIGNTRISYSLYGDKVEKIGNTRISYSLYGDRVEKIGNIRLSYSLYGDRLEKIGGMRISYSLYGDRVESVSGNIQY